MSNHEEGLTPAPKACNLSQRSDLSRRPAPIREVIAFGFEAAGLARLEG